jgi:hypothetical protein
LVPRREEPPQGGTALTAERESAGELRSPSQPLSVRPCWVINGYGRQPGLLLEWRRVAAGWQGRVVRPVREVGAWVVVEEVLAAELLEGMRA